MYGEDFWNRARLQTICEFIRTGTERYEHEPGTPEELHKKYADAHVAGMRSFRDSVLAYDWAECKDEREKNRVTDELWTDALIASGCLIELSFDTGFRVASMLAGELYQNM